jgi:hypothetical protein
LSSGAAEKVSFTTSPDAKITCRGTSACPENVVVFVSVWHPAPAKTRRVKMLMKPAA